MDSIEYLKNNLVLLDQTVSEFTNDYKEYLFAKWTLLTREPGKESVNNLNRFLFEGNYNTFLALNKEGSSFESAIKQSDLPNDVKNLLLKYIEDVQRFTGRGAGGPASEDELKQIEKIEAPITDKETSDTKVFLRNTLLVLAALTALLNTNLEYKKFEFDKEKFQLEIEQEIRMLDQAERELDIKERELELKESNQQKEP
ncbi:hypothetical protein P7D85_11040 [Enterococcus hulanensis]|uniref:Uncharacterized protein n=1 Tax=Enterococcus hulanensis TaxID=2559929 RepID=A0ABU3EZK8_9ENTE|nr:hypothetical protein [Enterococcus hulanensis]MDT2600312.1 hypothetical protein [Enterococcus hulanensis]MDT2609125.1 hypothetical protein [Enterococcus hulanensis]MDT2616833.1 hypothetical protein [Enterococcus hulanensis]MDT2628647.1 hypothetical protein [Enterococcus hulanensis]MDT2655987.1 hypothetical protein [Enterococcus hulanensis]